MRIHHPGPVTLQLLVQRRNHRTIRPSIDILPEHRVIHQSQRKPLHKIHKLLQLQIRQLNPHLSALLQDTVRHSLHTVQPVIPTLHTPAYYHTSHPHSTPKIQLWANLVFFIPFRSFLSPFIHFFPKFPTFPLPQRQEVSHPPAHHILSIPSENSASKNNPPPSHHSGKPPVTTSRTAPLPFIPFIPRSASTRPLPPTRSAVCNPLPHRSAPYHPRDPRSASPLSPFIPAFRRLKLPPTRATIPA